MNRVLKPGVIGQIVTRWQILPRGQGFMLDFTGIFDAPTEAVTRAFQDRHQLDVDGKVGNQTFGKAAMLGFGLVELVEFTESQTAFSALPAFAALASNAARQTLFGPLEFVAARTATEPEAIRIVKHRDQANLAKVMVPQLKTDAGRPKSGNLSFYKKGAGQLRALWQAWADRGLLKPVVSFDGAFSPCFIRGAAASQILSNHAFATAFDINASLNRLGAKPATAGALGCMYELVPVAHEFGFYWGGHFSRRDGMHFEVAKLL